MLQNQIKEREEKTMKKSYFKENKGITLIALVVTIVVLIILATISIDAVPTDGTKTTVELLKSISENVLVKENQNIVLNMNGKTITNREGTEFKGDWNQSTFEVYGDLEVNNGKIVAVYGDGIENYGNVVSLNENMEVIAKEGNDYPTLYNEGSNAVINVNGGTITNEDDGYAVYNNDGGTVEITGGTINGKTNLEE